MISVLSDEHFMKAAIQEAEKAAEQGEVPVGAVVVCKNQIIARAHNQTQLLNDVTAHAEMLAITSAAIHLGGKYLHECTLYVTLEPCTMCGGALYWAQLGKLVFGASDQKRGIHLIKQRVLHPRTTIIRGVLEKECSQMLTQFFETKRKKEH